MFFYRFFLHLFLFSNSSLLLLSLSPSNVNRTHADYVYFAVSSCVSIAFIINKSKFSYLFADPIDQCSVDRCILRWTPLVANTTKRMYSMHSMCFKWIDCIETLSIACRYCLRNTWRFRNWIGLVQSCCHCWWTKICEY